MLRVRGDASPKQLCITASYYVEGNPLLKETPSTLTHPNHNHIAIQGGYPGDFTQGRLIERSLSRTGLASSEATFGGKWLELLSEIAPGLKRVPPHEGPEPASLIARRPANEGGARLLTWLPQFETVGSTIASDRITTIDREDAMQSRGDEQNESFAPGAKLQDIKAGVESGAQAREAADGDHRRRQPSKGTYEGSRAPLAERIRARKAE
jgi:hypothetical protein